MFYFIKARFFGIGGSLARPDGGLCRFMTYVLKWLWPWHDLQTRYDTTCSMPKALPPIYLTLVYVRWLGVYECKPYEHHLLLFARENQYRIQGTCACTSSPPFYPRDRERIETGVEFDLRNWVWSRRLAAFLGVRRKVCRISIENAESH